VLLKNVEEGETAMKQFFVLMVVLALAAGTATVVTAHPTSGGRKLRGLLWRKFLSAIPVAG
jgi:hypothetical protein